MRKTVTAVANSLLMFLGVSLIAFSLSFAVTEKAAEAAACR